MRTTDRRLIKSYSDIYWVYEPGSDCKIWLTAKILKRFSCKASGPDKPWSIRRSEDHYSGEFNGRCCIWMNFFQHCQLRKLPIVSVDTSSSCMQVLEFNKHLHFSFNPSGPKKVLTVVSASAILAEVSTNEKKIGTMKGKIFTKFGSSWTSGSLHGFVLRAMTQAFCVKLEKVETTLVLGRAAESERPFWVTKPLLSLVS